MFILFYSLNPAMIMWHHCCPTPSSYVQITDCVYPLACELERSLQSAMFVDVASALTATLMKASIKKRKKTLGIANYCGRPRPCLAGTVDQRIQSTAPFLSPLLQLFLVLLVIVCCCAVRKIRASINVVGSKDVI